jgi:hypothetical protein
MSELVKMPNSKVRADEIKQQIEILPIPRSVRLSPRTKLELAGHVAFLLFCEAIIWFSTVRPGATHKPDRTTATILFGAFTVLVVWQFCAALFNMLRGSYLLRQGQVAVAVVTKQWRFGRRNSRSKIQYSFTTPAGEKESGEGIDLTGGRLSGNVCHCVLQSLTAIETCRVLLHWLAHKTLGQFLAGTIIPVGH